MNQPSGMRRFTLRALIAWRRLTLSVSGTISLLVASQPTEAQQVHSNQSARLERLVLEIETLPVASAIPLVYQIGTGGGVVSADSVEKYLTSVTKPAVCIGRMELGAVKVTCDPLEQLPAERQQRIAEMATSGDSAGLLGFVKRRYSREPSALRVLCLCRDTMQLSVADIDKWQRDFPRPDGRFLYALAASAPSRLPDASPEDQLAIQQGAVAILRVNYPLRSHGTMAATELQGASDSGERPNAEAQLIAFAEAMQRGGLDSVHQIENGTLAQIAERMRLTWTNRVPPQAVTEFIRRYGKVEH